MLAGPLSLSRTTCVTGLGCWDVAPGRFGDVPGPDNRRIGQRRDLQEFWYDASTMSSSRRCRFALSRSPGFRSDREAHLFDLFALRAAMRGVVTHKEDPGRRSYDCDRQLERQSRQQRESSSNIA